MQSRVEYRPAVLCAFASGVLAFHLPIAALANGTSNPSSAETVIFNDLFVMRSKGQHVDVSRFANGNPITPGEYLVDLYLNGDWLGRQAVRFDGPGAAAAPCLDKSVVDKLNIEFEQLTAHGRKALEKLAAGACLNLSALIKESSWSLEMADLRLDLSIPQAMLRRMPRGYVSPEYWDNGVPSATLAYNLNSYHLSGKTSDSTTFLGLDSGINLGGWHFRQRSAVTWNSQAPRTYENIATYVQRDISKLSSQLTLGDAFTDGAVFDSFGIRGVQISSDDRMLPESLRGYAPTIRGVAQSNARVTVTQNGNKLYETTVSPGPFEIKDMYATGYGGNLQVTVTEADGRQQSFIVPYASVTQLLRPGITRFSVAAGEVRNTQFSGKDKVLQATVQQGLSNLVTGYSGLVVGDGYLAALAGAAFNTPLGAVSIDATKAKADIRGIDNTNGQSFRVSYSKFVPSTNTNFTVAAYRHSSSGYWQMQDAFLARDRVAQGRDPLTVDRQRNQYQLTLSQDLGDRWGNLYATGSSLDYWNRSGSATQFQVGYNNNVRALGTTFSYSISASRQREVLTGRMSNQVYLTLTMPLGRGTHAPTLSLRHADNSISGSSQQATLNGSALPDNSLSYGLNIDRSAESTVGGGNIQYRSPYSTVSTSASTGSGNSQYSAGLSGAIVAHPGGVTLANDLGETVGVIEAKDARGARITNAPGVSIDARGYAVVPYLTPYSINTVDLDPKGLPLEVELKSTSAQIAPRANSVVMIRFGTVNGRAAVVSARQQDGSPLPFGASVLNEKNVEVGAVGQGGRIFIRGADDAGTLKVALGSAAHQHCLIDYRLPPKTGKAVTYAQVNAICRPPYEAADSRAQDSAEQVK
ncbi:fimbria/pilus outer membrane usher protein [Pigmentiphaga sp. YJ18]|uniref:fimbria/pilus outer membrane usher protein n=1 Tax=Pigmentiphaga sp. YJ18 TaxID=3134907 RepID=UPI0031101A35